MLNSLSPLVYRILMAATIMLSLLILPSRSIQANERIALIIGNSAYKSIQNLHNPKNDATDVANKLKALDFELFENKVHYNLTEQQLIETHNRFANAAYKKEIALLFYAGHGMQFDGQPYLLPVDVPFASIDTVKNESVSLNQLIAKLDNKADLSIAIFDACRNIPDFESQITELSRGGNRSSWRGLSRPAVRTSSTIVAFSGAAGEVVADGIGRNSPYTTVLLSHLEEKFLKEKSLDVPGVLNQVAYEFKRQNPSMQSPELLSSGIPQGRYYFKSFKQKNEESITTITSPVATPSSSELPKLDGGGTKVNSDKRGFCTENRLLCIGGAVLLVGAVAGAANGGGGGNDSGNGNGDSTSRVVNVTVQLP